MFITSKRGAQDNIVTYEHICDTTEDLQKIDPHYITLGSTCIVVQGENGGVDAYIATSDKQWVPLGGGSGGSEEDTKKYEDSDVRFIDYDGKVVYGYSAEEFLQLNKMPKNPNHKKDKIPLTAQGWNWDIEDAQAYVRKYGKLNVGQMYIPSDGKTHMVMALKERLTIPLTIQQTVSEGVTINWGDGSEEETIEGTGIVTTSHTYASEGEYDITLDVADGCTFDFGDGTNNVFENITFIQYLKKLYIGNGVTSIGARAFYCCYALTSLIISDSVTSIGTFAFTSCFALTGLTLPDSVTSIGQSSFASCSALTSLSIPDSVTSIGTFAFNSSIALTSLTIPDGVTSIGTYTFMSCSALTSLSIPDSVTSIGMYAFSGCAKLYTLTILAETPPTLSNVNAFTNIPTDCTIYVPYSSDHSILAAYKAANNWSAYADRMTDMSPKQLQTIAASGRASEYFNIGDDILIPWTDYTGDEPVTYEYPFVVAHIGDCYDKNDVKHENAIWLMAKYAEPQEMVFDAAEDTVVDLNEEPNALEGWHYFGLSGTTYTRLNLNTGDAIPTTYDSVHKNGYAFENMIKQGCSFWYQSAIRQWLNSDAAKNTNWWTSQHLGDIAPESTYTNKPGWLYGFTDKWKAIFKPIKVETIIIRLGQEFGTQPSYDKFFLPSVEQMYGKPDIVGAEDVYWEYWKEVTELSEPSNAGNDARKIKSITDLEAALMPGIVALRSPRNPPASSKIWNFAPSVSNGKINYSAVPNSAFVCQPSCVIY